MKKGFLLLIISIFLVNTISCLEKEDPNGHEFITFINNSDQKIYLFNKWSINALPTDSFFSCISAGRWKVDKGDSIKSISSNYSWEKDFEYIPFIQYFVFSEDFKVTDCQEISVEELTEKYQLKRYLLTQSDLEEMNWTITYP